MDYTAGADQIRRIWADEARRQDMKVVDNAVRNNCMAGIVAPRRSAHQMAFPGKDVYQFPFAFITPPG